MARVRYTLCKFDAHRWSDILSIWCIRGFFMVKWGVFFTGSLWLIKQWVPKDSKPFGQRSKTPVTAKSSNAPRSGFCAWHFLSILSDFLSWEKLTRKWLLSSFYYEALLLNLVCGLWLNKAKLSKIFGTFTSNLTVCSSFRLISSYFEHF